MRKLLTHGFGRRSIYDAIYDLRTYPLPLIDIFFAALRIVTNADTGYAQLVVRPKEWAINYKADLPPLAGRLGKFITIRKEMAYRSQSRD